MTNKQTTLIIKERGEGKTTQLLYTSATTQYPIIVQNTEHITDQTVTSQSKRA